MKKKRQDLSRRLNRREFPKSERRNQDKQVEEKLRQSEERYRSLFDRILDGIYLSTHKGRFVDVNPALVKMFGYSSKKEMLAIPDIKKELYFSPEERESHILDTGQEEVEVYRMRRRDGSEVWVEDHGHYVHDEQGNIIFHEGILRDITERKRAEEQAAKQFRELQQVLDSAVAQIWYLNLEGCVVNCNRVAQKVSGVTVDQARGKTIHTLAPTWDDTNRRHQESLVVARTGQPLLGSIESFRIEDETRWVRVDKIPWRDAEGTIIGVLMFIYDITERKQKEHRLSLLHEHALRLASSNGMDEIVKYTLDAMELGLGFDYADIRIVKNGWLRGKGARGRKMISADLPLDGPGVTVRAVNAKRTVLVPDTSKEPCYVDRMGLDWNGPPTMLSELAVPVLVELEVAAVLNVESIQPGAISDDDQTLLETLAAHVASAITRLRHEDELRRYSEHLEELVKERSGKLVESEARYRRLFESSPISLWEEDFSEVKKYLDSLRSKGVTDLKRYFIEHPEDVAECGRVAKILDVNEATLRMYGAKTIEEFKGELSRVLTNDSCDSFMGELVALGEGKTRFESEFENQTLAGDIKHVDLILTVIPGYEDTLAKILVSIIDLTPQKQMEQELRSAKEQLEHVIESNPAIIYIAEPLPDLSDYASTYQSKSTASITGFEPEEFSGERGAAFWSSRVHPDDLASYRAGTAQFWRDGHRACEYRFLHKNGTYRWIREEANVIHDSKGNVRDIIGFWTDITDHKQMEEQLLRSQRLAAIGETASMVAHDLRNPLQGITGAVDLLKQESLTAKERDEMLQLIQRCISYSDAIVKDLMEYSTEIHLKPVETTPISITRDALRTVKVPENVTVHNLSQDHPTVRVDSDKIRRVIINIVENAIDAMPHGGTLSISSSQPNSSVEITISDTGSGISDKIMKNLWKPLQTTKAKGLGLGLAICKRIVDAHGGSISVKTKTSEGTNVTIHLPIKLHEVEVK